MTRALGLLVGVLSLATAAWGGEPERSARVLHDFTKEADLSALRQGAKSLELERVQDADPAKAGLLLRSRKGDGWATFNLGTAALPTWQRFDYLAVDLTAGADHPAQLRLELADPYAFDGDTSAVIERNVAAGRQTLLFRIDRPRRGRIDPIRRWLPIDDLGIGDMIQLDALTRAALSWHANKDRDTAVQVHQVRLIQTQSHRLRPEVPSQQTRLLFGFEQPAEIDRLLEGAENAQLVAAQDKGVTEGKNAARLTAKHGANPAAITIPKDMLQDWADFEYLALDVYADNPRGCELTLELADKDSTDYKARSTQPQKLQAGQQTLLYRIADASRNERAWHAAMHQGRPWTVRPTDDIRLDQLAQARLLLQPPADQDVVLYVDNLRLVRKTPVVALYECDFEEENYIEGQGEYYGRWMSNQGLDRLTIEPPAGTGNDSKQALTYRLKPGPLPEHVSVETTELRYMVAEPEGWDGVVSFKVYNGGFKSFNSIYLPAYPPSDVTFHEATFDAPKGQWATITLPLDKYLYLERRPRRCVALERLTVVAEGPESDKSFYQVDDVQVSRVKQAVPSLVRRFPVLPKDVLYQQNFDDPLDSDVECFFVQTAGATVFRAAGGTGPGSTGCLKIVRQRKGTGIVGGRILQYPADTTVIEFDACPQNLAKLGVLARADKLRAPQELATAPADGKWAHYKVSAKDLAKDKKGVRFDDLYFTGTAADETKECSVLIDNLVFRRTAGEDK